MDIYLNFSLMGYKLTSVLYFSLIFSFFLCHISCKKGDHNIIVEQGYQISLKWSKSYPKDSKKKAIIGMKWIMAYLGASLPEGIDSKAFHWLEGDVLQVDLSLMGFNENAIRVWGKLLQRFKSNESYQLNGSMDIGRFVMLSFNSSWHYYALTGVAETYQEFETRYKFDDKDDWVIQPGESCVSPGLRIINSASWDSLRSIAHIAKEGIGETLDDFDVKEFEVFDYMPNGHPRFAIYGLDGKLKSAANSAFSGAGKPSKCMWCHESQVSATFVAKTDTDGYLNLVDVNKMVMQQNEKLIQFHSKRKSTLNFDRIYEHELGELLYVGFEYPDSIRLLSELEGDLGYSKLQSGSFEEYTRLDGFDKVFFRSQIDSLYHSEELRVPDMREASKFEPNYLKPQ